MKLSVPDIVAFHERVTSFYYESGRHEMAWRQPGRGGKLDPYKILVSELMLQQTQVARVEPKYAEFMAQFPNVQSLAAAPLAAVLKAWSGLGYNRRAKYLWEAARVIHAEHKDQFPKTYDALVALPGIGPNTAGAMLAYAFDQPVVYLETNIRTVLIHHFFGDKQGVADAELRAVLEQLVPGSSDVTDAALSPRQFYWALMDYGSFLKKSVGNKNTASRSYTKQSAFHGSKRQVRGQVLRLLKNGPMPQVQLQKEISDERLAQVLEDLMAEGLLNRTGTRYRLG
ncbi:MAG TPA: hypothetical protein VK983_03830 [Candidatus Limnocylindrales bacterium]|nr:hypothetical protein [Candidatus Limnocylindrales bacterium]